MIRATWGSWKSTVEVLKGAFFRPRGNAWTGSYTAGHAWHAGTPYVRWHMEVRTQGTRQHARALPLGACGRHPRSPVGSAANPGRSAPAGAVSEANLHKKSSKLTLCSLTFPPSLIKKKKKPQPIFFKSNFVISKSKSLELSPTNKLYNWKEKKKNSLGRKIGSLFSRRHEYFCVTWLGRDNGVLGELSAPKSHHSLKGNVYLHAAILEGFVIKIPRFLQPPCISLQYWMPRSVPETSVHTRYIFSG